MHRCQSMVLIPAHDPGRFVPFFGNLIRLTLLAYFIQGTRRPPLSCFQRSLPRSGGYNVRAKNPMVNVRDTTSLAAHDSLAAGTAIPASNLARYGSDNFAGSSGIEDNGTTWRRYGR